MHKALQIGLCMVLQSVFDVAMTLLMLCKCLQMWVSPDVVINKLIKIASQLMFLGGLCFTFHMVYLL